MQRLARLEVRGGQRRPDQRLHALLAEIDRA